MRRRHFLAGSLAAFSPIAHRVRAAQPKQVLALWYGWWQTPAYSGIWNQWRDVNETKHTCGSTTYYPLNGVYDSTDPSLVESQVSLAQSVGITGFIADWWGTTSVTDTSLGVLVGKANVTGFKVSAQYVQAHPGTVNQAVSDILYLLRTYASNPCWLLIGSTPVIFIYGKAVGQFSLAQWSQISSKVAASYPGGVALIGSTIPNVAPAPFVAKYEYTLAGHLKGQTLQADTTWANTNFPKKVSQQSANKVTTLTVMPGFDNRNPDSRETPLFIDRFNGSLYTALWQAAIKANPDWVMVSTWNELHEGSDIEPTYEFGTQYTDLTKKFAPTFLGG